MKSLALLLLATVVYADGLVARRRGAELQSSTYTPIIKTVPHTSPKCSPSELLAAKVLALVLRDNAALNLANVELRLLIAPHQNVRWLIAMATVMAARSQKARLQQIYPDQLLATLYTYIITCTNPGIVALTFDDGPYKYTNQVLDVLKKHNIKATFFITGNNLGKGQIDDHSKPWPKILRRMHSEGHQLASHSWSHQDLSAASNELRKQQIIYNEMAFRNVLGFFPKYLRPPYGTCSRDSGCLDYVTKLGYHVVNWNIDTKDYLNDSPSKIQTSKNTFSDSVSTDSKSNSYIELSHDIHEQTAYNLTEFMVKTLKARGYRAVPVGECLGDARENWYVDAKGTKSGRSIQGRGSNDPPPTSPATTKDGTCGAKNGLKCTVSKWGNCCSYYNFWYALETKLSTERK
ncbi:hypothetical protein ACHAPK_006084 [Fusarium culmorum]